MKKYANLDGIIGQQFKIGYLNPSVIFSVEINDKNQPVLKISTAIDIGENELKSSAAPSDQSSLCNRKYVQDGLNGAVQSAYSYVDAAIAEMTGGTTGNNVMLLPQTVEISNIAEGESQQNFGTLQANKFIDRVIFEVFEPFIKADGTSIYFSVGTDDDKEMLVPKFNMAELSQTKVVNVYRTLTSESTLNLYIYYDIPEEPEPEPEPGPDEDYDTTFTQQIFNEHADVDTSFTTDAMGNVVNVTITGSNLTGSVLNTEDFGTVEGDYMDFGVNIPLRSSGASHYRVVQMNSALAYYSGKDEYVSNQDGIWTKDKEYTITPPEVFQYNFLLGASMGADDYAHIYVYDLDSETPDQAFRSYHIKNELTFAASNIALATFAVNSVSPASTKDSQLFEYEYLSASESSIGVVEYPSDDGVQSQLITLKGDITDRTSELLTQTDDRVGMLTQLTLIFPVHSGARTVIAVDNPVNQYLIPDVNVVVDENHFTHYVQTISVDASDGTTEVKVPVILEDRPMDKRNSIGVVVMEIGANGTGVATRRILIQNLLTYHAVETASPMMMASRAADVSETAEPTLTDSGSMRVRILSF